MKLADLILQTFPSLPSLVPTYLKQWTPGSTPLSTTPIVLTVMVGYLTTIFSIRAYMNMNVNGKGGRDPFVMNGFFRAHNLLLSLGSGVLLVLMAEEIGPVVLQRGLRGAICDEEAWTPRMEFYYIVNYYIKYYELIDTVFLALKKKHLAFLHVFHHAATALLCFNQLNGRTPVSWTVITLNLFVHVIMYYYYYGTAGGRRFWWKQHVTTMQISQFIIDLAIVYYASFQLFSHRLHTKYTFLPATKDCAGSENAAILGCGLLSSYLFLFIQFFIATYIKGKKNAAQNAKTKAKAKTLANGNGCANGNAVPNGTTVPNGVMNGHANGNGVAKSGL